MTFFGVIRWSTSMVLSSNRFLLQNNCKQIQTNGSIRLINMFEKILKQNKRVIQIPKKPLNGYTVFFKKTVPVIKRENPSFNAPELAKTVAKQWKELDPNIKESLVSKANKELEEYRKSAEEWRNSLSEEQKEEYLNGIRERKRSLAKRRLKTELKRLEFPIKPKTAFNLFIKDVFEKSYISGQTREQQRQHFRDVVNKWNALTDEEKAPFLETAKIDKIRFLEEMKEWKANIATPDNQKTVQLLTKLKTSTDKPKPKTK